MNRKPPTIRRVADNSPGNLFALKELLNDHDLGLVWCAPWQVEITDAVKPSGNQLEIDVANLWPNRLIGDQTQPPEKRVSWTTWNPYRADSPLLPSGLLGPVWVMSPVLQ